MSRPALTAVVASSELGDDLTEAFGVLAQKADIGQPLHRTVAPQRGGHIADGSGQHRGLLLPCQDHLFSPL